MVPQLRICWYICTGKGTNISWEPEIVTDRIVVQKMSVKDKFENMSMNQIQ